MVETTLDKKAFSPWKQPSAFLLCSPTVISSLWTSWLGFFGVKISHAIGQHIALQREEIDYQYSNMPKMHFFNGTSANKQIFHFNGIIDSNNWQFGAIFREICEKQKI